MVHVTLKLCLARKIQPRQRSKKGLQGDTCFSALHEPFNLVRCIKQNRFSGKLQVVKFTQNAKGLCTFFNCKVLKCLNVIRKSYIKLLTFSFTQNIEYVI